MKFQDEPQKATTGSLLGAALAAPIGNLTSKGNKSTTTEPVSVEEPASELQNLERYTYRRRHDRVRQQVLLRGAAQDAKLRGCPDRGQSLRKDRYPNQRGVPVVAF